MSSEKKEVTVGEEGINAKFDWQSSFFRQVERINESKTLGNISINIRFLEALLAPYLDEKYKSDKDQIFKEFQEEASIFGAAGVPEQELMSSTLDVMVAKYSALMKLAFRKKINPQKNIPDKIIGSEENLEGGH